MSEVRVETVAQHPRPKARVSVILLDWGVRESFHSLDYLNNQTVDRDLYELVWVEFYDRKPEKLCQAYDKAQEEGRPPYIDKWVVCGYPRDVCFHKHRMYNVGIAVSEGEICVICDSDAMFTPRFIERVIAAFEGRDKLVVHFDEVRSVCRDFYPFNYPTFEEFLASECPNWTGTTTKGLADKSDMLHSANYGACFCARRQDLIEIGGADEHLDYLGYICGPYELTFRFVNRGFKEEWIDDELLYHAWHPGESGINVDYSGPSDGRGIALRSLEAKDTRRVLPYTENVWIQQLRESARADRKSPSEPEYEALCDDNSLQLWRAALVEDSSANEPERVSRIWGFDVISYRRGWYAVPQWYKEFSTEKVRAGRYSICLRGLSREQTESSVRGLPLLSRLKNLVKLWVPAVRGPMEVPFSGTTPQLVQADYCGFNILYYKKRWYAQRQGSGPFSFDLTSDALGAILIERGGYRQLLLAIRVEVARQRTRQVLARVGQRMGYGPLAPTVGPQLVAENLNGYNVVALGSRFYAVPQGTPFEPTKIDAGEPGYGFSTTLYRLAWLRLRGGEWIGQPSRLVGAVARRLKSLMPARVATSSTGDDVSGGEVAGSPTVTTSGLGRPHFRLFAGGETIDLPTEPSSTPRLVREGVCGYNIIHYENAWYGLKQGAGEFAPERADNTRDGDCIRRDSYQALVQALHIRTLRTRVRDLVVQKLGWRKVA